MYIAKGEVSATSILHGTPSGEAYHPCDTFQAARKQIRLWIDTDHISADHSGPVSPRGIGEKFAVECCDWRYWIEPGE